MINAWSFVDADDDIVADLLASTIEIVLELDGWLNPSLRIVARDGQLQLDCAANDSEPLIFLPTEAYVRVGRVGWSDSAERLEVLDVPDDFNAAEHELLILQTALHNQCGKVPWLVTTHPVLAPDLDESVIAAVRRLRPDFRVQPTTAAGVLWSTRCLRIPPAGSTSPEPMALPIVDLLNHHGAGATGVSAPDGFSVTVRHASGTGECFLDYGADRDALDLALDYGFVDVAYRPRGRGPSRDPELLDALIAAAGQNPGPAAALLARAASVERAPATSSEQ